MQANLGIRDRLITLVLCVLRYKDRQFIHCVRAHGINAIPNVKIQKQTQRKATRRKEAKKKKKRQKKNLIHIPVSNLKETRRSSSKKWDCASKTDYSRENQSS